MAWEDPAPFLSTIWEIIIRIESQIEKRYYRHQYIELESAQYQRHYCQAQDRHIWHTVLLVTLYKNF